MSRTALIITMLVLGANASFAGTFDPAPYLAEAGVQVLTKEVANDLVDRDLFGDPYATVVVGNIDVYEGFPYLEARYFQIVSDPGWDRLLFGEIGKGLDAYDGKTSSFGALSAPRGMSTDGESRVFVADTKNNRVLAFRVVSEYDEMELVPEFEIDGLSRPYDVAWSDAGTPEDADDDRMYVANSGRNEVLSYRLGAGSAELTGSIGELGSAEGSFAGPMALTVGRREGVHTDDVYVSDAHNRRIVQLVDRGGSLAWNRSLPHDLGLVTSLDSDHWGNVYAAAPQDGSVAKYTPEMIPIARIDSGMERPRAVHIPFVRVHDHAAGETRRAGQGSAILMDAWDAEGGIRLMKLGVDLQDARVVSGDGVQAEFVVTDRALVVAEIVEPGSERVIARSSVGYVDAGRNVVGFVDEDFVDSYSSGDYELRIEATSSYDAEVGDSVRLSFAMSGEGGPALPSKPKLLGNQPNPFNPSTTIRFVVPNGPALDYRLDIYDATGRLVRQLASGRATPGVAEVRWNGVDDGGSPVSSGIYLYRLIVGDSSMAAKMVLVK